MSFKERDRFKAKQSHIRYLSFSKKRKVQPNWDRKNANTSTATQLTTDMRICLLQQYFSHKKNHFELTKKFCDESAIMITDPRTTSRLFVPAKLYLQSFVQTSFKKPY